jgi:heat shock protein HslJ
MFLKIIAMKKLLIALVVIVALQSCTEEMEPSTVKETKWELKSMTGSTLPSSAKATLNFTNQSAFGGKSFCNSYGGKFTLSGNSIQFSEIFGTKMYCGEVANAESEFLKNLELVDELKLVDGKLKLLKKGRVMLIFTPLP